MMILFYHFVCYSDLVEYPMSKFVMGLCFMTFVLILIFSNIANIAFEQIREYKQKKLHLKHEKLIK